MLTSRLRNSIADAKQRHCSDCEPIARKARAQSEDYDASGLPPSSAKIRMMLKLLQSVKSRSGGKEKTIIFSQVRISFILLTVIRLIGLSVHLFPELD